MSSLRLIIASLGYHWRTNLAVACGVAVGTAVLSGALLVGDSMRVSLRELTLDRLGAIEAALTTGRFFRADLAGELAANRQFQRQFAAAVPMILLRTSLEWQPQPGPPPAETSPSSLRRKGRVNQVNLIGCDQRFWQLGSGGPQRPPKGRQIVLNRPLARDLDVDVGGERIALKAGDRVMLRLPRIGAIPAESALGRKRGTVQGHPVSVSQIIPAEGLGRFSLRSNQQRPRNAYVPLDWLQDRLDQAGRVNAILVAGKGAAPAAATGRILQGLLKPKPTDYGIRVELIERAGPSKRHLDSPANGRSGYFNITSGRLLLEPAAGEQILHALAGLGLEAQPALTYLANTLACGDRQIPYSTITGVDPAKKPPLGPLVSTEGRPIGPLGDDQIVLNTWAAQDLGARPGETIRVTYFEPETTHAAVRETSVQQRLAAVVRLSGAAADPAFTPEVPGVTDRLSMAQWDPPFPFDARRIRPKDEQYWADYRATPKAFVSLQTARRLWGSRFGRTTSIRVPRRGGMTVEALRQKLAIDPAAMGWMFQPVKQQGLEASAGTTPFSVLFLAFSCFIIAAAVLLVALLFRLGVDQRAAQLGILVAVGFRRRRIALLLAAEGLVVAAVGSLLGVPAGVAYAALMVLGLRTWWVEAVVTPFLRLHLTPPGHQLPWSLVIGVPSGVIVALVAIVWSVWRSRRFPARRLLAGQTTPTSPSIRGRSRYLGRLAIGLLIGATALALLAPWIGEEAAFFAAGALVLIAALTAVWTGLRSGTTGPAVAVGHGNLLRMALRGAARNPGRSTLTIGLVAAACFVIVAVSAFRLDPKGREPDPDSGNGGFALVAESDRPIYHDLSTAEGRQELGFPDEDLELLAETTTIALRVKPGDDASCLNLYRPRQPRILGVPKQMIDRGGFVFADSTAESDRRRENPWLLLEKDPGTDADGVPWVPVILDKNTATYSLEPARGIGDLYEVKDDRGRTVRLKIVGLLRTSIFQGDLLISQAAFLRLFPQSSGYRFFLIDAEPERADAAGRALEGTLGDYGLVAEPSGHRLARFLVVQNTYLSTFQNLGGLGLLLGTFGLAAVQLRNVLERRGELALLRAAGFRRRTLAEMVMLENGLLLSTGLASGVLAALVAVLPHLVSDQASVPWAPLAATLALVLAVGMLAGMAALRAVLRAPLLAALREER